MRPSCASWRRTSAGSGSDVAFPAMWTEPKRRAYRWARRRETALEYAGEALCAVALIASVIVVSAGWLFP